MWNTSPSMTLHLLIVSIFDSGICCEAHTVPAPAFHLILDTCTGGEVYNMIIRGGNEGGLDGIDVWGFNIYIHDVEVTNKDECVTVKVSHLPFLVTAS
jgi:hypothetical protein